MDIAYPKLWVPFEILKAKDLNDQFGAVAAVVNGNITDSNINGGAAIRGVKLASWPNGIANVNLNDLCVSKRNLQPGIIDSTFIEGDSITTDKIKNGTILNEDLADLTITNAKMARMTTLVGVLPPRSQGHADLPVPSGEVVIQSNVFPVKRGYLRIWACITAQFLAFTTTLSHCRAVGRIRVGPANTLGGDNEAHADSLTENAPNPGMVQSFNMPVYGIGLVGVTGAPGTQVDTNVSLTLELLGGGGGCSLVNIYSVLFIEELA
jgi:hypothetical protein